MVVLANEKTFKKLQDLFFFMKHPLVFLQNWEVAKLNI